MRRFAITELSEWGVRHRGARRALHAAVIAGFYGFEVYEIG